MHILEVLANYLTLTLFIKTFSWHTFYSELGRLVEPNGFLLHNSE